MKLKKDLSELNKRLPKFSEVVDAGKGRIKNYGNGPTVEICWGWNDAVKREQMVEIRIGKESAIIDTEELLHYTRAA